MNRFASRSPAAAGPQRLTLRPLCALLAALPLWAGAQEAQLGTVTVQSPKAAVLPLGAAEADAPALAAERTRSSDIGPAVHETQASTIGSEDRPRRAATWNGG